MHVFLPSFQREHVRAGEERGLLVAVRDDDDRAQCPCPALLGGESGESFRAVRRVGPRRDERGDGRRDDRRIRRIHTGQRLIEQIEVAGQQACAHNGEESALAAGKSFI